MRNCLRTGEEEEDVGRTFVLLLVGTVVVVVGVGVGLGGERTLDALLLLGAASGSGAAAFSGTERVLRLFLCSGEAALSSAATGSAGLAAARF